MFPIELQRRARTKQAVSTCFRVFDGLYIVCGGVDKCFFGRFRVL
jgi:hypothetical protein